ncbi:MAG: hypothetical protein ACM3PY_08595 [Omnitrophica WOR_2 bacterium]
MNRYLTTIRKPVKRQDAEHYLLITLLSFAASVSLTRLFLELSGYPQLGGSKYHIAHLLWGGLFLFIASLLPLILANRWIYSLSALFSGIGVGLFIDEVGKFITQNNDYFFPGAAPIIYAFFLLTVLLYYQVRKPPSKDPRTELYNSLEGLEDVLDHDLDARERADIEARLHFVASQKQNPDLSTLAQELLHYLDSKDIYIVPTPTHFWQKWIAKITSLEQQHLNRKRFRITLGIETGVLGFLALIKLIQLALASVSQISLQQAINSLYDVNIVASQLTMTWFMVLMALQGLIGIQLVVSSILLIGGKDKIGITAGFFALMFSLTIIDLLVFYFDQFSTILVVILQFFTLLGILYYRRRFIFSSTMTNRVNSS